MESCILYLSRFEVLAATSEAQGCWIRQQARQLGFPTIVEASRVPAPAGSEARAIGQS
jgi:hypothetical protein